MISRCWGWSVGLVSGIGGDDFEMLGLVSGIDGDAIMKRLFCCKL